ncbi:MAG: hypothetical protein IKS45_12485 [Thermoguttaceae bacterium]|nr:hypothetical protein [Thermoguttaceae bacterium]
MKQLLSLTAVLAVVSLLIGCGGNPYGTVKVSGKVVYEDGSPWTTPDTTVMFKSQVPNKDSKTYPRIGSAELNPDGTFSGVTTYEYNDGVIKGPCKIYLTVRKAPSDDPKAAPDYTDAEKAKFAKLEYFSPEDTPITMDIKGGKIEIKVAK